MKTKLEKLFEDFHKKFWPAVKSESDDDPREIYFEFKAEVLKSLSGYELRLEKKDEIIQNQINELISHKLETHLYKGMYWDVRKKLDSSDAEFEGYDRYQFEERDVSLYNKLPATFSLQEFNKLALVEVGADTEGADTYLWKYTSMHLVSEQHDGSYVKLLEKVPSNLNEIEFVKKRLTI